MHTVKQFIERWRDHGYERGESQRFWLDLLGNVFGVKNLHAYIFFEQQINGKFIDAKIPSANVLIEQKSIGKDLTAAYEQAKQYDNELPFNEKSRWIVTCDFQRFEIHDMNDPKKPPEVVLLKTLERECYRLQFLVDENYIRIQRELEVSIAAGEIVGKIYDALHVQYINPDSDESLKSLNKLCVRLVFCLYAESTGVFGKRKIFRDYLSKEVRTRQALIDLFAVLNTPLNLRDPYLEKPLSDFPYVNGGLFDGAIVIPNFTAEIRDLLLEQASSGFNWSDISPTIFGAVFESTLSPTTRRSGGMHYTSITNIHKVIDPLFMDNLREEFESCNTKKKLLAFQNKLASLKFFDPACGSGNFLTETYLSLRRIENELLKKLIGGQIYIGEFDNPVKVSIAQFYGIEINDFAVAVAKTALWISELQMMATTAEIIHRDIEMLPLKTNANIVEGNALRIDWREVVLHADYIIGNPPFVGASMMNPAQKKDAVAIFGKVRLSNSIDYVGAWYHKAAQYIGNTRTTSAFISTHSITQGEQVAPLWKKLLNDYRMQIIFGYRTFKWDSDSVDKAAVHCVIIGLASNQFPHAKFIYSNGNKISAENINPYLLDAPNILIESRATPICNVPKMTHGNKPTDDGNFIFSEAEAVEFAKKYPAHKHLLHRYLVARDFLYGKPIRYCLWLKDVPPNEYSNNPEIMRRLNAIRIFRENSSSETTRKTAETPYKFFSSPQPSGTCLCIPQVSSESRKYIPVAFVPPEIIVGDRILIVPNASLYHFGVLASIVHMAWMRVVCGRLGNGYNYSGNVVYNNFPWCNPTDNQRSKIERTVQKILDVRADYPKESLSDLYNESTMPQELRRVHRDNDRAVMEAYGFDVNMADAEIVTELMKLYLTFAIKCGKITQ